jgi:sigma-B regulation protein RsbU (phosphoserine phosphatase)
VKRPGVNPWSEELFGLVPRRARFEFFAAVFCVFAPLALLWELGSSHQSPWYRILPWVLFSGATAVGWAFAFVRKLRFLWLVVPLSFTLPQQFGRDYWGQLSDSRSLLLVSGCIALITLGYVFFIRFIMHEGVASLRLRTEMNLARDIHAGLVPALTLATPHLEVHGASTPTTEVGGDLLDCIEADERLALYVADVSGHGVPAGVFMAMLKSAVRMHARTAHDLGEFLRDLNAVLLDVKKETMFATFAALRFDGRGEAEYALAGHLPILVWRQTAGRIEKLENEHPPLGVVASHRFTARRVPAASGDVFLLLTDGLTEVTNVAGEEFGSQRVEALLRQQASRPLAEIHAGLVSAASAFGPQVDDRTLVLARVK